MDTTLLTLWSNQRQPLGPSEVIEIGDDEENENANEEGSDEEIEEAEDEDDGEEEQEDDENDNEADDDERSDEVNDSEDIVSGTDSPSDESITGFMRSQNGLFVWPIF